MGLPLNFTPSIPEYSVSEISSKIKQIVEMGCGYVRVRGEISGLKIATSGHGYFNLKDNDSVIASTCWRPVLAKMNFQLQEGIEVVASGKITTFAGQSKYQLSVDRIEPAGVGALMQILMQRKQKLEQEGLFDKARKRPLPFLPQKIGIITSITGAVIKDILHRIKDRCPVNVIIWPTTVQGDSAGGEIAAAIKGFNSIDCIKPDLIIVARGGGSIEDLWAFNEEVVVRAIASSSIPIISAVGHETDFTLSDFAADVRAPTPTAAAEFAVPVIKDIKISIEQNYLRLKEIIQKLVDHHGRIIELCDNVLSNPMKLIRHHEQSVDYLVFKMVDKFPLFLENKRISVASLASKIRDPKQIYNLQNTKFAHIRENLIKSIENLLLKKTSEFGLQSKLLDSLDYNNVLKRGFSIISVGSKVITSSRDLMVDDNITISMHDGKAIAKITSTG